MGAAAIMFERAATVSGIVAHATNGRTTQRSRKLQDIIDQHLPEIAEGIGVPPQTLKGWMEGKGEPTSEQAQGILDFLRDKVGQGPEV